MYAESKILTDYFKAGWTHTPVIFDQPYNPQPGTSWVRFAIRPVSGDQESIGSPSLSRYHGMAHVTAFIPLTEGDERLWWLSDQIVSLLSKRSLPVSGFRSLVLETAYPVAATPDNGEGWRAVSVVCPYWYDLVS